jgi:FdhE protein
MAINAAPSDLLVPMGNFPHVILPDPSRIFQERSQRFTTLAEGHSLSGWLSFLGLLTEIQHGLLQTYLSLSSPGKGIVKPTGSLHTPPISASSWPRDPSWLKILAELVRQLAPHALLPAQKTLDHISTMDAMSLEALADRVLGEDIEGDSADCLPFVAAALQVYWTALAAGLNRAEVPPPQEKRACPCCGFSPVAGIVRTDGEVARLRYLHCALCNTEWHLVRVICAACGDGNSVSYYHIEGSDTSVRAETCDACQSYMKIIYREKSPQADPVADDLATLALDLLVLEAGYDRKGPNLLFIPDGRIGDGHTGLP